MSKLRQLIRESITEYIREIDEAGNMAALEAKMSKTQEAIDKRKKMAAMEGIDEAYHDMLDKGKMKEITSEIKVLEKSLTKYEKMLEKLKSKADKTPKVEEEKEIVDEVAVDLEENEEMEEEMETEGMKYEGMDDDEERFDADGTPNEEGMYDAEGNRISFADIDKAMYDGDMNESFLHMQKLAGVISETEYNEKVEEARFKKGTDIGKKGPGFEKIEKAAAKEYGSEEAGKRVAGSILKKVLKKK
jgi:hypothetical protein